MRIVGGKFRGLKLAGFDVKGIRPTTDRVREALFNILAHDAELRTEAGPFPAGATVLDVFAGTGAFGLEALSRGASTATFIDNDPAAQRLLRDNITRTRTGDVARVLQSDACRPSRPRGAPADFIFMDPPYGLGLAALALAALKDAGWIAPSAMIIVESDKREELEFPDAFSVERIKDYGRTRLSFLRPA
jgi:16S rRNA (guanine966-N2)-methyltransferase